MLVPAALAEGNRNALPLLHYEPQNDRSPDWLQSNSRKCLYEIGKRWCQYRRERPGVESSSPSPYSSTHSTPTHQRGINSRHNLGSESRPHNNAINRNGYSEEQKHENDGTTSRSHQEAIDNANKNSTTNSHNR